MPFHTLFHIKEHVVPCQHIRQCHSSNTLEEQTIRLSVKQYSPTSNPLPRRGDITILAAHANGFVKELYEPLWEDLEERLRKNGRRIRSIWIADVSNQGASGLLNEDSKYDDVSWNDHARDLLHMVNFFREEMVHPIVAVGHSMGANQLMNVSLAHFTLFQSLVLIDPIIAPAEVVNMGFMLVKGTLRRKVEWPSREAAEKTFKNAFNSWDPRVLERFNNHALYPYPQSRDFETSKPRKTRLITGRFQELLGFLRPSFIYNGDPESSEVFWAREAMISNRLIEFIPCNTLYVCGALSVSAGPEIRKDWLTRTSTDRRLGQARPLRSRKVEAAVLPDVGHFVPMEAPTACAEAAAKWIEEEMKVWEAEERSMQNTWRGLSAEEKERRANSWMKSMKAKI